MRFSPTKLLHGLLYTAPVLLLTLAACGGGGGGSTPPAPVIPTYTIGGTIVSVDASSVVLATSGIGPILQNNGGDNLFIPAIAPTPTAFTFNTPLADGAAYLVTQLSKARAPTQTCAASGVTGTGTVAGANITTVEITCSVSPVADPRFAYVTNSTFNTAFGENDTVSAYSINSANGELTSIGGAVAAGDEPYSVTVEPSGRFAYVANRSSNTISAYSIDSGTGALTALASIAAGTYPISVTVHPSAKFAYVANQNSDNISVYSINTATGALTNTLATIATGIEPYAVVVDPTGRFAYVANYTSDNVSVYTINQTTGALTFGTPVSAGDGPSSIAIDPTGKCALVVNNISERVMSYMINQTTGELGLVVDTVIGALGSAPRSVAIDPDSGLYAYVTNFGLDNISAYSVNLATCAIAAINADGVTLTIAAGDAPFSINVDPSGQFVYVANFLSNNVSVYSIGGGGALTAVTPATAGTGPTSVTTTQ